VLVGIYSDLDRGVTKSPRHILNIVMLEVQRSVGMSQTMDPTSLVIPAFALSFW